MSIDSLFDHACDIYHMTEKSRSLGYGIRDGEFLYPDKPDEEDVPCHFNASPAGSLQQTESANEYIFTGKLQLPAGTDIRVNDKIVDKGNGLVYYAEIPKNIRDHHMVVMIQRKGTVKGAL